MGEHHRVIPAARGARSLGWLACGAFVVGGVLGCESGSVEAPSPASSTPPARTAPVDSTDPGELAEGDAVAFGLRLPRRMRVHARFDDAIHARGSVGFEAVSNYVRQRLNARRIDTGPSKTVFDEAVLKSDPNQHLRVDVLYRDGVTRMVVHDRTPKPRPFEPGLSDAERWKRQGLTPDGKMLPELNE